ncbi:MAG: radical SAM family heme chaperone HemW [Bacteroidales bacterium]|nr:radical SAM family heme chaperone HemW [Bacteroidales bacterium]
MAGIYVHIPFCRQKCGYCNFYSIANMGGQTPPLQSYVDALISEINFRKNECTEPIKTLYLGGGTPSMLDVNDVVKIFETLQNSFVFAKDMEISFEGNPESLSRNYLLDLRNCTPVNRLSIGVQSFFEDDLNYLNRKHSPKQAIEAIENAQKAGFERLSVDLIYGIPTLTDEKWNENLQTFFSLNISHLSAYALTVEPNTILDKQIQNLKTKSPNEEQIEKQYLLLREQLRNHGFEAYETSNFCKNKQYSKHNSNYWNLSKYYGFGASAHSFLGTVRSWNIADVNAYITSVKTGILPSESEFLTTDMRYNEYVMTAIRTQWGISQDFIKTNFDERFFLHFQNHIAQIPNDWLICKNNHFITTENGALFSDAIAERLFI